MTTRGRLITLEGGEGAGKSTQARFIRDWLIERGREVVLTREPGGSPLAESIRGVVLGDWAEGLSAPTEALLMFAARAAHWQTTIGPALAAGRDVVCDRFIDSSYAYQGAGHGVSQTHLQTLEQLALEGQRPDLTLLLDLDPQIGLDRAQARGGGNRFEHESQEFMQRVRAGFLARAAAEPERIHVIDAGRDVDAVSVAIEAVLAAWHLARTPAA